MAAALNKSPSKGKGGRYPSNSDMVEAYLAEVRRFKLLSREKEIELAEKGKNQNDQATADKLVSANLRLVLKIALSYHKSWGEDWSLLDLIQEGNVGLVLAAKKYDLEKKAKFSSYASFWIKAYIIKFIMNNWSNVKIGNTMAHRTLFFNLKKEKQKLIDRGIEPDSSTVSKVVGFPEQEIIFMEQQLAGRDLSLNVQVNEETKVEKVELIKDKKNPSAENLIVQKEKKILFIKNAQSFKSELNTREVYIFESRMYCENPESLQSIGDRYEISRERVRQVETKILKKAKTFFLRNKI